MTLNLQASCVHPPGVGISGMHTTAGLWGGGGRPSFGEARRAPCPPAHTPQLCGLGAGLCSLCCLASISSLPWVPSVEHTLVCCCVCAGYPPPPPPRLPEAALSDFLLSWRLCLLSGASGLPLPFRPRLCCLKPEGHFSLPSLASGPVGRLLSPALSASFLLYHLLAPRAPA